MLMFLTRIETLHAGFDMSSVHHSLQGINDCEIADGLA